MMPVISVGFSWRWWILIFISWIGLNVILVYGLDWDGGSPGVRSQISRAVLGQYQAREFIDSSDRRLKYRILIPPNSVTPQPLLIFLHGSGQRGEDNASQLVGLPSQLLEKEWRQRCPGFVLAPQCPSHSHWERELPSLISLIETWKNDARVDSKRVYLTGFSMGGFGTWSLAAARPDCFAAVIPICGGGDVERASKLVAIPIWAVHGSDDRVIPPDQSRRMIDAIRAAGGNPKYTELIGVGHDSWSETYRDSGGALLWMYQQVAISRDRKIEPEHP